MLRAVLDTNVFVSGLLIKNGQPARLLDAWRSRQFILIISPAIIAEIYATLNVPRIRRKYAIRDEDVDNLIQLLKQDAQLVPGEADVSGAVPDDPDDKIVLASALDGGADRIVSGDRHLLDLGDYRDIPIQSVRQFSEELEKAK